MLILVELLIQKYAICWFFFPKKWKKIKKNLVPEGNNFQKAEVFQVQKYHSRNQRTTGEKTQKNHKINRKKEILLKSKNTKNSPPA